MFLPFSLQIYVSVRLAVHTLVLLCFYLYLSVSARDHYVVAALCYLLLCCFANVSSSLQQGCLKPLALLISSTHNNPVTGILINHVTLVGCSFASQCSVLQWLGNIKIMIIVSSHCLVTSCLLLSCL